MMFIFVVVIVNALVQSSECGVQSGLVYYDYPTNKSADDADKLLFLPHFEFEMTRQFLERQAAIVHAWRHCSKTFATEYNEAGEIFANRQYGDEPYVSEEARCLVDCTMRKMKVMTDDGLDDAEYMLQIRQLRYNYTSYDINKKSSKTKRNILDAIWKLARRLPDYDVTGLNYGQPYSTISPKQYLTVCYNFIRSYTLAARKCKKLKDPNGDSCETSWKIMRCMRDENRQRSFDGPFYPIDLNALQDS